MHFWPRETSWRYDRVEVDWSCWFISLQRNLKKQKTDNDIWPTFSSSQFEGSTHTTSCSVARQVSFDITTSGSESALPLISYMNLGSSYSSFCLNFFNGKLRQKVQLTKWLRSPTCPTSPTTCLCPQKTRVSVSTTRHSQVCHTFLPAPLLPSKPPHFFTSTCNSCLALSYRATSIYL